MRVISLKDADELKCHGCGFYEAGEGGLCGECFSEMLALDFDRPLTIAGKGCLIEVPSDG